MTSNQGKILAIAVVVALVVLVALSACQPKGSVFDKIILKCDGPCEFYYFKDDTGRQSTSEGMVKVLEVFPPLNQ